MGKLPFAPSPSHPPLYTLPFALPSQPNGARKEAFDDLNWGLAWIQSSPANRQLLRCLLSVWAHPAFDAEKGESPASGYHKRSQPRVNHLLELAERASHDPAGRRRVCTYPKALRGHYLHATSPPLGTSKLVYLKGMAERQPWSRRYATALASALASAPLLARQAKRQNE